MTQEEKQLLLQDLCVRLPYGVKVRYSSYNKFITCTLHSINPVYNIVDLWSKDACFNPVGIDKIKPYLFPLTNLTEEQRNDISKLIIDTQNEFSPWGEINIFGCDNLFISTVKQSNALIKYCIINHFDINGFIDRGLAIDATNLNIY